MVASCGVCCGRAALVGTQFPCADQFLYRLRAALQYVQDSVHDACDILSGFGCVGRSCAEILVLASGRHAFSRREVPSQGIVHIGRRDWRLMSALLADTFYCRRLQGRRRWLHGAERLSVVLPRHFASRQKGDALKFGFALVDFHSVGICRIAVL